jgi:hypothetical protein
MIVMAFPASAISRSWLSSSGSQGRLPYLGMIILSGAQTPHRGGRATWPIPGRPIDSASSDLKSAQSLMALVFVVLGLVGLSEHAAAVHGVQTFERQGRF